MLSRVHSLLFQWRYRLLDDAGQDLVEYALVAAMISLGAVAGMRTVASDISNSFTHLASVFNSQV